MQLLFTVCFGVGVGYTVIGFLLGEVLGFFNFNADLDTDFDTDFDIDFDSDFDGGTVSPVKPVIIAAFITVFGGSGLLLYGTMNILFVLSLSGILGLLVAYIMYAFVIVPLHKAQNTSAVEIQSLVGNHAKVTEFIPQGQYGKITYYANGNTYSSPAKSENGDEIARNAEVEIVSIVKNTYYVKKKEAM